MCRLATFNRRGVEYIEKTMGLENYLDYLERQCGGHGNGYLFIKDGEIVKVAKGKDLKNKKIAKIALDFNYDWFMYHTRIASAGSVKDSNCHPYWNRNKTFALMMNGTVSNYSDMAKAIDITDTDLVFRNILAFNIPVETLLQFTPKFMGFKNGKIFVSNPSGYSGLKYIEEEEALIIASSFPVGMKNSRDMDKQFWWEGESIKENRSYRSVGFSTVSYGREPDTYNRINNQKGGWGLISGKKPDEEFSKFYAALKKHYDVEEDDIYYFDYDEDYLYADTFYNSYRYKRKNKSIIKLTI